MNMPSKRRRLSAYLLDGMVYVLVLAVCLQFKAHEKAALVLFALFDFVYNAYLVYRFDGTPGKRVLGLAIEGIEGSSITFWMAIKRHYALYLLGLLAALPVLGLAWMAGSKATQDNGMSIVGDVVGFLPLVNVLVILFNENRRALHDYVAGTVVRQA
jgi:uncharacterized RDD family membrane protein YckC